MTKYKRFVMLSLTLATWLSLVSCRHTAARADEKAVVNEQTAPASVAKMQEEPAEHKAAATPAIAELPPAEKIIERSLEVTGQKTNLEKVRTRVVSGTFGMPTMNIKGSIIHYQALPNKSHLIIDIPGIGKQEVGCDGETVWEKSSVTGSRILSGQERVDALFDAMLHGPILWHTLLRKVETIGVASVDGKPAYKVLLIPVEGSERTAYYDQKTGLLVRWDVVSKTQMGEVPTESYFSDFKLVDGIQMPLKTRIKALSMEQEMVFTKVEQNVDIPPQHFVLPAEIKALIEKNKAGQKDSAQ